MADFTVGTMADFVGFVGSVGIFTSEPYLYMLIHLIQV